MNKETIVVGWSFGLFLLMNMFVYLGYRWQLPVSFLWIAGGWVIISVILFFVIKHPGVNVVYILCNAVMAGLAIGTYYEASSMPLYRMNDMLWWGLGVFVVQWIVMQWVRGSYKVNTVLAWGCVAGIVYGIYHILRHFVVWGSALIFLFVFMLCLNIAIRFFRKPGRNVDILTTMKLVSMLLFGGVLMAVLCLLSDGDALEFFAYVGDAGLEANASKKRT